MAKQIKTKLEWQMDRSRLEKAASRAAEILAVAGALRMPIDPFAIATSEGITLIGDDFRQRFDGQLEYHKQQNRFLLFYNTKYDSGLAAGVHHPRTRFSVGHELGHFYLDAHHAYLRRGGVSHKSRGEFVADATIEREADAFSAALLLPAKIMRPLVNEDQLSFAVVEDLAGQFNTSLVSTALRCVSLSDFPCAMVGICAGLVAWSETSPSMIAAGFYPPRKGSVPSKIARERWAEFASGTGRKSSGSAVAREWFRTYERDDLEGVHVSEHFLPVPSMETLVALLTIPEDALREDDEDDSGDDC